MEAAFLLLEVYKAVKERLTDICKQESMQSLPESQVNFRDLRDPSKLLY